MIDTPKLWPPAPETPSTTVMLAQMARGGIVFSADLACELAVSLLEAHYGANEVQRQKPLLVTDNGNHWRVEGSWNRDQKLPGPGAFFLSIQKSDGRVLDIGTWSIPPPPPDSPPPIVRSS